MNYLFPILALCGAWFAQGTMQTKLLQSLEKQKVPPVSIGTKQVEPKKFTIGFHSSLASATWIRLLQFASHTKSHRDETTWEGHQLDWISDLDPKFQAAYIFGSSFLSVFRQDKKAASELLEKWVKQQPRNWRAHYLLGFHLYSELEQYEKAYPHILKAAQLPRAPTWLASLGVRLLSQTGAQWQALKVSLELYESLYDVEAKYRIKMRVESLIQASQKQLWEQALKSYQKEHHRYPQKIEQLREHYQQAALEVAPLYRQLLIPPDLTSLFGKKYPFTLTHQRGVASIEASEGALVGVHPWNPTTSKEDHHD